MRKKKIVFRSIKMIFVVATYVVVIFAGAVLFATLADKFSDFESRKNVDDSGFTPLGLANECEIYRN